MKAVTLMMIFLWIVALGLPAAVALSVSNLLQPNTIAFREPDVAYADGSFSLSGPFFINNTGFFDLSDVNASLLLATQNHALVSSYIGTLPAAGAGSTITSTYRFDIPLNGSTLHEAHLLTESADLNLNASLSFSVISLITLGIGSTFVTRWRAPFSNLTISNPAYDQGTGNFSFSVSFTNSANFEYSGILAVKATQNDNQTIGSIETTIRVSLRTSFQQTFVLYVGTHPFADSGTIEMYFDGVEITQRGWSLGG